MIKTKIGVIKVKSAMLRIADIHVKTSEESNVISVKIAERVLSYTNSRL